MSSFALYVGLWITTCIQTQINHQQGFVTETYSIEETGKYHFTRTWFEDNQCTDQINDEEEFGQITLGNKIQGIFVSEKTVEANFHVEGYVDLGALGITKEGNLKVARGFKGTSFRNTMLSIFDYTKQH